MMKLTKLLTFAAAGVAIGLLLTKTEKGNQIRKDLADAAGKLTDRLKNFRAEDLADLQDEATNVARKARKKADGLLA